ncbi:MAG: quinoprotein relay system zinc metallohydrolase 2 [Hyphomicrobiaceae bacterium]
MTLLSRRSVLRAAGALSACTCSGLPTSAGTSTVRFAMEEVAPGVFVSTGQHELFTPQNGGHISNVSFVIGRDGVAVVDTGGSAGVGRALLAAIRRVTDRPIRYVINTHMHPDHVFGNAPFLAPETLFAGHVKLARSLAARGERYLAVNKAELGPDDFEGTRIVAPSLAVDGVQTLDLGERMLTLTSRRTAHTDNDLTVRDEKTGTLFLGDLLFSGHVPTLDGSIKGWLTLLAELRSEPAARVVPGHGPASMAWPVAMDAQAHYLDVVARDVRKTIAAGQPLEVAMGTAALNEKPAWLLFDDFHARNVAAAFAELEWE